MEIEDLIPLFTILLVIFIGYKLYENYCKDYELRDAQIEFFKNHKGNNNEPTRVTEII